MVEPALANPLATAGAAVLALAASIAGEMAERAPSFHGGRQAKDAREPHAVTIVNGTPSLLQRAISLVHVVTVA